jgi:hypothetical protein
MFSTGGFCASYRWILMSDGVDAGPDERAHGTSKNLGDPVRRQSLRFTSS